MYFDIYDFYENPGGSFEIKYQTMRFEIRDSISAYK